MDSREVAAAIRAAGGLANQADLARRWRVSDARVGQLVRLDGFPEPVGEVGGRPVWLAGECDGWKATRRPGRPPAGGAR
jgi:hypothetical protein